MGVIQGSLAEKRRVGLVGAGKLGLPIALRIELSGAEVVVVDVSDERLAEAESRGLKTSSRLDALVDCDVVFAVVAKPSQVLDVLNSQSFVTGRMAGKVFVVVSTIGPGAMRSVEKVAASRSLALVDCPVTGGVERAEAGDLTLFMSGESQVLEVLRPLISNVGRPVHCGDRVGDGQAFKMVNNMLAVTNLVAVAEALAFGSKLGLEPRELLEVLPAGTAASWMLSDRGQRLVGPSEERVDASTFLEILAKDAALVVETASSIGASTPLSKAVNAQWVKAIAMGLGRHDDTAIIETYLGHEEPTEAVRATGQSDSSDSLIGQ